MTTSRQGRVWLITGASSGFGRAIAQAALDAGDSIIATARSAEALEEFVAAASGRATAIELDVTDAERAGEVVTDAVRYRGRIDVLVNNAGYGHVGAVEETTPAELRRALEVMFFGAAELTRRVLPHMRARRSGAIVQMSSMGGQLAFAGVGAYCAAKFALEGFSEALAEEIAPFGIKVMIVEPGAFRTRFNGSALQRSAAMPAYDATVGPIRAALDASDGTQPGDPAKAASAIMLALDSTETPLRLPLGNDAVDAILGHLDSVRSSVLAWEPLSRQMGVDDDLVAA